MSSNSQTGASFVSLIGAAIDNLSRYHGNLGAREGVNQDFVVAQTSPDESDGVRDTAGATRESLNTSPATDLTSEEMRNLLDILMNVTEGGFFTKDLLNGYASTFLGTNSTEEGVADKFISIYHEPGVAAANSVLPGTIPADASAGADTAASIREAIASNVGGSPEHHSKINTDLASPDRINSPHLSAILLDDTRISPTTRDADAVALFCNMIPPVQMSMCAPYLDLRFFYNTPAVTDGREKTNNPALVRFLGFGGTNEKLSRNMAKSSTILSLN